MIRTRLTLWNAVIFALALALVGAVVFLTTKASLERKNDGDLLQRMEVMQHHGGPGGPGGGPDGPGGPHDRGRFHDDDDHRGAGGPPPGEGFGPGNRNPGPPPNRATQNTINGITDPIEALRLKFEDDIHRPRFFSSDMQPAMPNGDRPLDRDTLRIALAGSSQFSTITIQDHPIRVLSFPIRRPDGQRGAVQIASDLQETDAAIARLGQILLYMLPLCLIGTTLLGIWLTNRALAPVRQITKAAEQIEATNLSERLPVKGSDEFAVLSNQFNSMLDRISNAFNTLENAYEAQRRFVADASHELKTPLTTIKGRVGLALMHEQTPERYVDHLNAIGRASNSMAEIIQDLLLLAKSDEKKLSLGMERVSLFAVVGEAIEGATTSTPADIHVDVPEDLQVAVDASLFKRVLVNLLTNAIRHSKKDGQVAVSGRLVDGMVQIQVADKGEGIAAEDLPHLFDRFYRVDASRNRGSGGSGLGLAIARSIVEAHGGKIAIESVFGAGTTVTILLPSPDK